MHSYISLSLTVLCGSMLATKLTGPDLRIYKIDKTFPISSSVGILGEEYLVDH